MYQQLKNAEFVVETLSIMGGLLILLAHLSLAKATRGRLLGEADGEEVKRAEERVKRLGLLGRTLLVALFLYSGWTRGHRFMTNRVYAHVEIASWVARCAEGVLGLGLLGLCALVVLGMRSRFCALMMACLNFISNMFLHPFWIYMFSDSYYKFPEVMESLDDTRMQNYPMTSELYASHQRYFFFQSMSYTGALLLLVVHGPGQYSIDEPGASRIAPCASSPPSPRARLTPVRAPRRRVPNLPCPRTPPRVLVAHRSHRARLAHIEGTRLDTLAGWLLRATRSLAAWHMAAYPLQTCSAVLGL